VRVSHRLLPLAAALALVAPVAVTVAQAASHAGPAHHAAGAAKTEPGHGTDPTNLAACDDLDTSQCLLPFPNDWWTRPDPTTLTGRRVDFTTLAMPRNVAGIPINPSDYNELDGFSPGATIITHIPGVDTQAALAANHLVTQSNIGRYAAKHQRVVVIDAATGKRWPIWSEIDANAGSPAKSNLFIHPAVNFHYATRYIVAIRNLVDSHGVKITPTSQFRSYLNGTAAPSDPRRAHMTEIFRDLAAAGIRRKGLDIAWDFTVASSKSISGRLLAMRNQTFAGLGDTDLADLKVTGKSPKFHVASVTNYTKAQDPRIARKVVVDVTVPCYIWPTCSVPTALSQPLPSTVGDQLPVDEIPPGAGTGHFVLDGQGPYATPRLNSAPFQARVECNIPRQALRAHNPVRVRPSLYGHGLFGSAGEVDAGNVKDMSSRHAVMFCAPYWVGMAEGDIPNAVVALVDLSQFPLIADRMQQGVLDFLVVGRAMIHPNGFSSDPAFQLHGHSIIKTRRLYYDGNSQGGIYGGTVCSVLPDANRCVIGVTGMDYSMLLYRSSDFVQTESAAQSLANGDIPAYATPFEASYRDPAQRPLILDLIQMLWDRSDPNGYAAHMTTHPLPNTPKHHVLMQIAFGDHQVANVTAEAEARTIGAHVVWPALESKTRDPDTVDYWHLPRLTRFPYNGSALTVFDVGPVRTVDGQVAGTNAPPMTDTPNFSGVDPHEAPRATLCGQQQKSNFLWPHGLVTAPCGGPPYFAFGYHNAAY
jgi:hypothetical protein